MESPLSNSSKPLELNGQVYRYHDLGVVDQLGQQTLADLPYSLRVLLESMLRNCDGTMVTEQHIKGLASWSATNVQRTEIPFLPGRVILQDFTGVPCVVDLAAMRDAMKKLGGDPARINPEVPCDLVIDHSVQVDDFAQRISLGLNAKREFERNNERYQFLKWGQQSLHNFRVVPPATGIVHQVNLEYLAQAVLQKELAGEQVIYPDSVVGTDSHTTMINGLGVVGWGVGGIEAEAVMLGQPIFMLTPEVVGFRLHGQLGEGTTATDLVLHITQVLRERGVVEKFVEFIGPGVSQLSLPDRATVANMAPEYGATMGFFPTDAKTVDYLRFTGRRPEQVALVEAYCKANHLFVDETTAQPQYSELIDFDLAQVKPSLAGPKRPQDLVLLEDMKPAFHRALSAPQGPQGLGLKPEQLAASATVVHTEESHPVSDGLRSTLHHGAVVIAAITSCTNTSNPDVMIAAGLVARKARARGLSRKPWVKTSLAPGSQVVTAYLDHAGLSQDFEHLGFHTVGYGCTTCIGNAGPLPPEIDSALANSDVVAASVLSGNRNFEGRIHPLSRANYLASPPLVVAYAIAGTVDIDFSEQPLGTDGDGNKVYLKDIWPTQQEVEEVRAQSVSPEQFQERYGNVFDGNETWNRVPVSKSELYPWQADSTYIQNPPFFDGMQITANEAQPIVSARCLAYLGDSVTTDHISPAGSFTADSPAGKFLATRGVADRDFNSYGSRRGNDRIMTRGTFANVRVRNRLAADAQGNIPEGGFTKDFTDDCRVTTIYEAAQNYRRHKIPLIVIAGKDYGMGSSRDWAAKGTNLLGVKAVIAQSFERIHRSNLVFMGVLPLQFGSGDSGSSLGLDGDELFDIQFPDTPTARCEVQVKATKPSGGAIVFKCLCRIDTPVELEYYRNGGILQTVIRKKL